MALPSLTTTRPSDSNGSICVARRLRSGHPETPHVNIRPNDRLRVRRRQPDCVKSFDRFWHQQSQGVPWSNVRDQPRAVIQAAPPRLRHTDLLDYRPALSAHEPLMNPRETKKVERQTQQLNRRASSITTPTRCALRINRNVCGTEFCNAISSKKFLFTYRN